MRTALRVEFDRQVALDSFNALIRKVNKAGAAIKAFASAVALLRKNVKRDLKAFDKFEERRGTEEVQG